MTIVISILIFIVIIYNILRGRLQSSGSLLLIISAPIIIFLSTSNWFIYFISLFFNISSGTVAIAYFIIGVLFINILYLHIMVTDLTNKIHKLTIEIKEDDFKK